MALNIEGESERVGGVRQPVYEVGQSNLNNEIKNQIPNEKEEPKISNPSVDAVKAVENPTPPMYGNPQMPFYGNNQAFNGKPQMPVYTNRPGNGQNRRRLRRKRKNRPQNQNYTAQYPAYNQQYGYYAQYAGYNQYPGYTQSYPGYTYGYPQAQSYTASPQLSMVKSRRRRPLDVNSSTPSPKSRRRYPKVCGDRTSHRKHDNRSYKTYAVTSRRGMKAISQEEKSIPMLEVIAPYRKCEGDIEENPLSDLSEAEVYVEVADKLLTNKYLEEERKHLEHSRKVDEKSKNKWEQLLKSSKKEEDLLPETIAAVIFSEEKGLSLKTVPEVTYQKLFPEDKFKPVVKIVKAGQDKNAMIPVSLSPTDGFLGDEDGTFYESYMKNDFEIPESMPTQVGSRTSEILSGSPNENQDFDIPLEPSVPSRENFVQLRGSVPPKWFPGYVFALPNSSDTIRVDQPYQVFEQGWRAFSPTKSSTPEGIIVVGN